MKKKLIWIFLLIALVGASVFVMVVAKPKAKEESNSNNTIIIGRETSNNAIENNKEVGEIEYVKTELEDGILYSIDGKKIDPDFVIKENYYDTTINDIYLNPEDYTGMTIEMEGMYLLSDPSLPYTFVGRYSTSNLCPNCPAGYSVLEYQLKGKIDAKLSNEKDWIKVIGTLKSDYDEEIEQQYYYISVDSLEIMNERGNDTVSN